MTGTQSPRTPMHLWPIGLAALSWSLWQAWAATLLYVRVPAAIAQLPVEIVQALDETAWWTVAASVAGIGLGLAGALALLLRWRLAVPAFALSLAATLVPAIIQPAGTLPGMQRLAPVILAALLVYARQMLVRQVLR